MTSLPISSASSTFTASSMIGRSESLPITMPTRTSPELWCRDGSAANVPPVMHPLEVDAADGVIGPVDRRANGWSARSDAEHAPTGRHEPSIALGGPGMEYAHALDARGALEPRDGVPGRVGAGIAARSQRDAHRRVGSPASLGGQWLA